MKTSPLHLVDGKYTFSDLVELSALKAMFYDFSKATGISSILKSYPDQQTLIKSCEGLCTDFHGNDEETRIHCRESSQRLTQEPCSPGAISIAECPLGMVVGSSAVFIKSAHVANVFTGQVFFEAPDKTVFREKAEKSGFDVARYLKAVDDIPIVSRESFEHSLRHLSQLAIMLGEIGLSNLKTAEVQKNLSQSEARFRGLVEHLPHRVFIKDTDLKYIFSNKQYADDLGLQNPIMIQGKNDFDLLDDHLASKYREDDTQVLESGEVLILEEPYYTDWQERWVKTIKVPYRNAQGKVIGVMGIFDDITDQVNNRNALKVREEQLSEVIENQTELICRFLPDGTLTFVNEAYCRYFDKTREELQGRQFIPLVHEDDEQMVNESFSSLNLEKPQVTYQYRVIMPSGEIRWQQWTDRAFFDHQGRITGYQAVGRDITQQKEAEEALKASEARYRGLLESQHDLIVRIDTGNRLTYVNDNYCKTFGKTREQLLYQSFAPLVHEDDIEHTLKAMEDLYHPPYRIQVEQRAKTVDGWRWLHWEDSAILNEHGEIVEIQGVGRDITELKNREETLQSIFKASLEVAFVITAFDDQDLSIMEFSPGAEEIFGYKKEEILNRPVSILHSAADPDTINSALNDLKNNRSWHGKVTLVRKNGQHFPALFSAHPFRMNGQPATLGVSIDITELEKTRQELVEARKKAESANQAKSQFLANMSHEIRTPMNAILGFAQILERDASLSPQQREHIQTINRSGKNLLHIINDILDISKIESGRIKNRPEDFNLHELLDDLEVLFYARTASKGLALTFSRHDQLPDYIRADQGMLRQILINLLANAVKFTEKGYISLHAETISASSQDHSSGDNLLSISIEDTGVGIPPEDINYLFEPFFQSSEGTKAGGTGLGLSISSQFSRIMQGNLEARSQPGKGSIFTVKIPFTPARNVIPKNPKKLQQAVNIKSHFTARRILVVDDQKDNRALLSNLLAPLGFLIQEAENGSTALEIFKKWQPHAILMDMRMPVMDGYEAVKTIRSHPKGREVYIMALTASAFECSRDEILRTGVNEYVRKPFNPDELISILGEALKIEYQYVQVEPESHENKNGSSQSDSLSPEKWPLETVQQMQEAVEFGDIAEIKALISRIEPVDPAGANRLNRLADTFDYQAMQQILVQAEENK